MFLNTLFRIKKSSNFIIFIFISILIFSIFTYIYWFSLKNIINLWTYSEVHLNYQHGFIRRGFFGEVLLFFNNFGIKTSISYSSIFYIFYLLNAFLFLKILSRLTNNIIYIFFFSFNPAFILFSFYDLGGYARSEVFGICLILLHTLIYQKIILKSYTFKKYCFFYFCILHPFLIVTFLIHEINIFFLIFHLILTYKILEIYNNKKKEILFKFILPLGLLIFFLYISLNQNITPITLQKIYENLPDNKNIYLWIWEALLTPISKRSEFQYMANPFINIIYYIIIFLFYFIPIIYFLKKITHKVSYHNIFLILSVLPFIFLFFIARDWGRWMHIIFMIIFCFYSLNFKSKINTGNFKNKYTPLLIIFIFIQIFFTRLPHCCNLIDKQIPLYGGFVSKVIVFHKLITNKMNINERFKKL